MLQHSGINVHNDELHIHPEPFCGSCRTRGILMLNSPRVHCMNMHSQGVLYAVRLWFAKGDGQANRGINMVAHVKAVANP